MTSAQPTAAPRDVVVEVAGVFKSFAGRPALRGIDLRVEAGESVGLLGPNGAGKTTLISLLSGLRRPDAGRVRLLGGSPLDPRRRLGLGVTPQATSVPAALRVQEVVDLVAAHYPDPTPTEELLDRFGLAGVGDRQCGALSGGQQRRLMVGLALVGRPRLALLDEPTTGLDVDARDILWAELRAFSRRGSTLLVTSHYLPDTEALADRVVVLNEGRVVADGDVDEIRAQATLSRVRLITSTDVAALRGLPGVVEVTRPETADRVVPRTGRAGSDLVLSTRDSDATVAALVSRGIDYRRLEVASASLEEAFRLLVSPDPPPAAS